MATRAQKLMQNFCTSLGQNLDEPIVGYLARMMEGLTSGDVDYETVVETINEYFTKKVTQDDLKQLQAVFKSEEEVKPLDKKKEEKPTSNLNAEAKAFQPSNLREMDPGGQGLIETSMDEFIENYIKDPDNDPFELLVGLYPQELPDKLREIYEDNGRSFVWTLDVLKAMKEGFQPVSKYKRKDTKAGNKTSVPKQKPKDKIDLSSEAFPALTGNKPCSRSQSADKRSFLDIAKKKKKPPSPTLSQASGNSLGDKKKEVKSSLAEIPWVVTGEAVSKEYANLRAKAGEFARLRNACFCEATEAYVSGNKSLARELGKKGRKYGEEMKKCHYEASETIFQNRNRQLQAMLRKTEGSPEVIDLHGLHVEEAKRILARELEERLISLKQPKKSVLHILVGTGHHTKVYST